MKVMTARDAKNHFGEFLDSARREPVVVTKNDRPVGIMISLEDAKDTLFADFLMEQEPGYGDWLFGKVTKTMGRVAEGATGLTEHSDAMACGSCTTQWRHELGYLWEVRERVVRV